MIDAKLKEYRSAVRDTCKANLGNYIGLAKTCWLYGAPVEKSAELCTEALHRSQREGGDVIMFLAAAIKRYQREAAETA